MTEYEARGVTVVVGPESLELVPDGRDSRVTSALTRRIPYGAIREVIFEEPRFGDALLHLALGDTAVPAKLNARSALANSPNPDTIAFKPGKATKAARQLWAYLTNVVDSGRAAGGVATSVTYDLPPTGEDALRAINHRKLDPTELRGDVASASRALMDVPKAVRKLLLGVSAVLATDEHVQALTSGGSGSLVANFPALLVLTDRRLFVLREGTTTVKDEMRREEISSVVWDDGLVGKLDVNGGGRSITLRGLDTAATEPLVHYLRSLIASPPTIAIDAPVVDQLERLAALRDSGALTQDEFDQEKTRVLGR